MNLLNKTSIKIAKQEVMHFETAPATEHNIRSLQVRKDRLLIMEALLKIDIEFCEKKGIDIADLMKAINRLSK